MAGAGLAAAGTVLFLEAQAHVAALYRLDAAAVGPDPQAFADEARRQRQVGAVMLGVGAAALVGAAGTYFWNPRPVFTLGPGGVGLGLAGRLP